MRSIRGALAAVAVAAMITAACGDDSDAGGVADQALARGQAEILRGIIKTRAGDNSSEYTVATLNAAIKDLPGNTTVNGLTDTNNDGKDDDGALEVVVENQRACLKISGTNTTVSNGSC